MDYDYYIFDLYGTLLDVSTDEYALKTWRKWAGVLDKAGLKHPCLLKMRKDFFEADKQARVLRGSKADTEFPEIDVIPIYKEMFKKYGNAEPSHLPDSLKVYGNDFWRDIAYAFRVASMNYIKLNETTTASGRVINVMDILKHLKDAGKKIYILSNAQSSYTLPEIEKFGFHKIMDGILISSDIGYMKPDRRFYEALLTKYNIPIDRAVMCGDSMLSDVEGARGVGLDAIHTPDGMAAALIETQNLL